MDKHIQISMLCQMYGKLLTKKQYSVLIDYYNNDLSLAEIAEIHHYKNKKNKFKQFYHN